MESYKPNAIHYFDDLKEVEQELKTMKGYNILEINKRYFDDCECNRYYIQSEKGIYRNNGYFE